MTSACTGAFDFVEQWTGQISQSTAKGTSSDNHNKMSGYKGRVALVTGASSGIGAAIAVALVKEGMIVVGVARRVEKIQALGENLKDQPGRLIAKRLDVSKVEEIVELFKNIEKDLGGVDVLVNNAAVLYLKPIHVQSIEEIQFLINVNQTSVLVAAREAINGWIRREVDDGFIVNINSIAGHIVPYLHGTASLGVYPTTKHALTAACKQLRHDLKDAGLKCRVTSISPGVVATEMTEVFQGNSSIGNYLKADDIAKAVAFVLSMPKSAEVTELTVQPVNEAY